MKILNLLISFLLLSSIKSSLDDCQAITDLSCTTFETEYEIPERLDNYAFQTPPRNDALGNYISTYQDMRYLVGWAEYNYNAAKTRCTIKFNAIVNPDMGVEDEDYKIYYTFGNFDEQESNEITLNSRDDSYPNGLSLSCRIVNMKSGNEAVSLQLQDVYLLWDNIEVDTSPEYEDGQRGSIVELFGWSMEDVAEECEFLGIAGYLGVKIFSPTESLLSEDLSEGNVLNPWWYGTQVASYKYDARSGNQKQLRKITNRCRLNNVRVYAEIVINHMTGEGNDVNPLHYTGNASPCTTWGPKPGSGLSPFFTYAYQVQNNYYTGRPPVTEYPAVPFFPSDFHCTGPYEDEESYTYGYLFGLQDINTEKDYPIKRIATLIVDLLSIGVSGVSLGNGKHIPNYSWAKILRQVKDYLGGKLPLDFMAIIILENLDPAILFCNEEGTLDFGTTFTQQLTREGFKESEILQIKIWSKGILTEDEIKYMGDYDIACGEEEESKLKFDIKRWTVSLEYSDDINMGDTGYNIYIKDKDVKEHKRILINNMFLKPKFNFPIRFVFSSFSIGGVNGIPDGKSEKSYCETTACLQNVEDLPFKRAFNPHSRGYDCGDGADNWKIGEYSRVHRDIDIINAMREWIYSSPDKNITSEELYTADELKAVCDEKCLICNEESKREDKCIFCDSDNNYYPVMEVGGSEEYYECHKRDARVERLYFSNRDKAFLPCYETCRYCNELGDVNNHKCTACDYNLIKKPGTKDTAVTFNCVTSCAYSYYYTESGQYKCTNTPVCPSDKNIYIEEKQKCVSSCKEEAPFIYLYNGNCVEECPSGYISDDENNICKLLKTDQCTLGSKVETLTTLYSASMLNSFAKGYRDEYTYTNKYVTRISNTNYKIVIFKEFDCISQLGLDIPDLRIYTNRRLQTAQESDAVAPTQYIPREDTCYTKVQKNLSISDNLIVVYIEDNSNLVAEKGYLLYNPITGGKINYETICGEDVIAEKEDETADEDSTDNKLRYIYLRPAQQKSDDGPTSCPEGESPLYRGGAIDYSKCLNKTLQYEGLYYDSRSDLFIPCNENCKYCSRGGSASENNCLECAFGYIKHPLDGRRENYNCVAECTYSYFFSSTGVYTCTPGPTCPRAYRYFIPEKNQCIDSCKNDDGYIFTYNGNCILECPTELIADVNGFCIEKKEGNITKCTLSQKEATVKNFDENGGLDTLVSNYFEEYYYTDGHISEYNSSENNILIYKQKNCLVELNLNFPVVDFGSCYDKVQNETGLNQSLIVVLVKKYDIKTGRSSSSYSLYNPVDGTKLDAANICKDEEIVVENNVLDILEESGVDYESMVFLTEQNIDIFDSQGAFYTDICYDFKSPINRDITLGDRLETFYPNISLCDAGCESRGVNLTTMKAICSCTFNDISNSPVQIGYLNEVFDILSSSNYKVLKCMKFMFKKFGSSIGGFLMLFSIIIVIFCGLHFYFKDLEILKKYILNKTTAYINYINEAFPDEEDDKKTNLEINNINENGSVSGSVSGSGSVSVSKDKSQNSKVEFKAKKQDSVEQKGDILLLNKINNSKEVLNNHKINTKLKTMHKNVQENNYMVMKDTVEKEDFNVYLAPNINDIDFEDMIIQDKRNFQECFMDNINDIQVFVNTFSVEDNFRPKSLKIILLLLQLILYCVIIAFFYGDDAISEIYHIEGDDPFFGFVPRSIERYFYCFVVSFIINLILDFFFVPETMMKKIFNRGRKNIVNMKVKVTKMSKGIIIRYLAFIVFVLVVFLLFMFYLLCFNYVYPHTQKEWIKSSIFFIIFMQVLYVLLALVLTCIRFIAYRYQNERILKITRWIYD